VAAQRNYVGAAPTRGIVCHLCRRSSDLTKAHIPPRCAGNFSSRVVRMRPFIRDGVMLQEPPLEGGLWLRTLCDPCNHLAGLYDNAYGDLANRVARHDRLGAVSLSLPVSSSGVPAVSVSPGRVARSILFAMVALAPSMNLVHSDLLDELRRDDDDIRLPAGLQVRVARIRHRECRISSAYSMLRVLGDRQVYDVFAEICFSPFVWALCSPVPASLGPSLVDQERWGDASDWIRYGREVERADLRDVLNRLPVTVHPTLRDRREWVELSASDASYVLEGLIQT
jgi:hypothetical protein